jgi:carnitine O-palmitoyltransferase 1, liver isoform
MQAVLFIVTILAALSGVLGSWLATLSERMVGYRLVSLREYVLAILLRQREWLYDQRSVVTQLFFGVVKAFSTRHPATHAFRNFLPRLPLPELGKTLEMYLRSVRPLLSVEEYASVEAAAREFAKPGGVGRRLQSELAARAARCDNWVSDWWQRHQYLRSRQPLAINVNWYGMDYFSPPTTWNVKRAANWICGALRFHQLLRSQRIAPVRLYGAMPLDMSAYDQLFGTTRVPGEFEDRLKTASARRSRHVALVYRSQWFAMSVFDSASEPYTLRELEDSIQYIVDCVDDAAEHAMQRQEHAACADVDGSDDDKDDNDDGNDDDDDDDSENVIYPPIGVLTSDERSTWARARSALIDASKVNRASLDAIESSLFVVCMDDGPPVAHDLEAQARAMFHGDGRNRWFDKSCQLITSSDAVACVNSEHSWADAPVVAYFCEFIAVHEQRSADSELNRPRQSVEAPRQPRRLRWHLKAPLRAAIAASERRIDAAIAEVDLRVLRFKFFGKGFVKTARMSPDGFIQMAFQLAYYRMHNEFVATYETATTRLFLHGRTETVRSCSVDAVAFVRAIDDVRVSDDTKLELLRRAVGAHVLYMRRAMSGAGCDRHLFALCILARRSSSPLPAIFADRAYNMPWKLSTSQTAVRMGPGGGFGPTVPDGYGISYMPQEQELFFHITSMHSCDETSSSSYADRLQRALLDMQDLCVEQGVSASSPLSPSPTSTPSSTPATSPSASVMSLSAGGANVAAVGASLSSPSLSHSSSPFAAAAAPAPSMSNTADAAVLASKKLRQLHKQSSGLRSRHRSSRSSRRATSRVRLRASRGDDARPSSTFPEPRQDIISNYFSSSSSTPD